MNEYKQTLPVRNLTAILHSRKHTIIRNNSDISRVYLSLYIPFFSLPTPMASKAIKRIIPSIIKLELTNEHSRFHPKFLSMFPHHAHAVREFVRAGVS